MTKEGAGTLSFDLGEIGDGQRGGADAVEQTQAILAQAGLLGVDGDRVEELIHRLPEQSHGGHGRCEILAGECSGCGFLDLVDAVFALGGDDLLMIVKRVEALASFLDTEDGANLLTGTKRAISILRIEEKKDSVTYDQAPDPNLLKRIEEKALARAVDEVEKAAAAAVANEDFEAAMAAMALLRAPVDEFFESVTVNTQEPGLRENRLRLLNRIRATTLTVADFSKIEG